MTKQERQAAIIKRRAMLKKREERAKLWLYTDDKPKAGLCETAQQMFRHEWLYRGMV